MIKNAFIRSSHHHFLYPDTNIYACATLSKIRNYNTSLIEGKKNWSDHGNALKNTNLQNPNMIIKSYVPKWNILRYKSTEPSTVPKKNPDTEETNKKIIVPLTSGEKLKKAVKEYGTTVIVFHIGISLMSLGTCYLLVSSGLDVTKVFAAVGLNEWATKSQIASSAGTFAVAYAIHKVFMPARIAITLTSVPLIVRYLRKIGFLKK
ncbi:protein FAM210B, mitochondrial-like [Anoplophora glabripennis]|uniref:protein FAM210B, mitochondrial-like n=1 Tax=Anoplophora glabripennis TaxID=217634 RepID=UPI0008747C86|nr:protein FAM210B, mitochondrial-like [Anoplophora glabripennis]